VNEGPRFSRVDRDDYLSSLFFDDFPVGRGQQQNRQLPSKHVLLMGKSLIAGYQDIEAFAFGNGEQMTVLNTDPAHIGDGEEIVLRDQHPELMR